MKDTAIFSISSKNYLGYARTLFNSIKAQHSEEFDYFLLLADELNGEFDPKAEGFKVVQARDIGIMDFRKMTFIYDITEFNTAIKPFFIKKLLNDGYRKIIYFDPDIHVFRRIDRLLGMLDRHSIIVTPHIVTPYPPDHVVPPLDETQLQYGVFNLGFVAVSAGTDAHGLAHWWSRKLSNMCLDDLVNGLFVDQKWMDLAPCFFDGLYVLRDRGYNMAWWNLHERRIEADLKVNGVDPLVFYHFSSFNINDTALISRHQKKFDLESRPDIAVLFDMYRTKVEACGHRDMLKWKYAYGHFDNNEPIGYFARRLYPAVQSRFPDPFKTGPGSYHELLKRKKLLEKGGEAMPTKEAAGGRIKTLNAMLKTSARLLGPTKYRALLKYFKSMSSAANHKFLLD